MREEQFLLLNKAKESLKAAKLLFDSELYAFSASRAYYSMFYVAEAMLIENELNFSKHSAVISAFGSNFAKTGLVPTKFHKYLIKGQIIRNTADYDVSNITSKEEALEEIENAQEFIDFVEKYFNKN